MPRELQEVAWSTVHTEAKDVRFSLLNIPDTAICHGRAENKVGACRLALAQGGREKRGGELRLGPSGMRVS